MHVSGDFRQSALGDFDADFLLHLVFFDLGFFLLLFFLLDFEIGLWQYPFLTPKTPLVQLHVGDLMQDFFVFFFLPLMLQDFGFFFVELFFFFFFDDIDFSCDAGFFAHDGFRLRLPDGEYTPFR